MEKTTITNGFNRDGNFPIVTEVSVTYFQPCDNNDTTESDQRLRLTATLADECMNDDDNFPFYINMEILPNEDGSLGHWSFPDADELNKIIDHFKNKVKK